MTIKENELVEIVRFKKGSKTEFELEIGRGQKDVDGNTVLIHQSSRPISIKSEEDWIAGRQKEITISQDRIAKMKALQV